MSVILEWALYYARDLYWPVFPVAPRGKLPLIGRAHRNDEPPCRGECGRDGHGLHDATTDPERGPIKEGLKKIVGDGWGLDLGGDLPSGTIGGGRIGSGTAAVVAHLRSTGVPGSVSSAYRPGSITSSGNLSLHSIPAPGGAKGTDLVGPSLMAIAQAFLPVAGSLKELIFTPLGFSIKDGKRVAPYAQAQHFDHVHVGTYHGGGLAKQEAFLPLIRRDEMILDPNLSRFVQSAAAMAASPVGTGGLAGSGRALIQGLAGGIRGGLGPLQQAMQAMVDVVKNTVSDALQIHSPSQVFAGFGAETVEGLMEGLRTRYPALHGEMDAFGDIIREHFRLIMQDGDAFTDWLAHMPERLGAAVQAVSREAVAAVGNQGQAGVVVDQSTGEGTVLVRDHEGDWVSPANVDKWKSLGPNDEKWWTVSPEWVAQHTVRSFHRGGIAANDVGALIRRDEMVLDPDLSRFVQDAAATTVSPIGPVRIEVPVILDRKEIARVITPDVSREMYNRQRARS